MQVVEGACPLEGHETWYRVTGDLASGKTPLVVVHGGPGCTHDYVDSLKDVAASGRAVVHYDQLGNGRSTHLREAPASYWTVDLFLAELDALLRHLGIEKRYALYGQSWGGMLSAEHAVRRPAGLEKLVIANSPSSMPVWVAEANRLRLDLPPEVQETLLRHERAGTTASREYQDASRAFYARHVCRLDPWPPEVTRTFDAMDRDSTVYLAMNGPTEFHVIGSLKDWTIVERLHTIAVPTLIISGRHDEATPLVVGPYAERILGAEWVIFEQSSHMPHVEERDACMTLVVEFLDRQPVR